MTRRHSIIFTLFALVALVPPARPADSEALKADLATLKAANLDTDTKALVAMIQKRTVSEETRTKVAGLIKELGSDEFDDREKASEDLIKFGSVARPQLIAALRSTDLETKKRARRALDKIGPASADAAVLPAVARVLADRKPTDVAELLLNFLPSIEEFETAQDFVKAMAPVAKDKDGKADPAMVKALADKKYAIKRWAAGDALTRGAVKAQRDNVLKLLDDEDVVVRQSVSTALLEMKDKASVAALILLRGSDTSAVAEDAEDKLDLIREVSGNKAPAEPADLDSPKARQKYVEEWEKWWKTASEKFDMSKIDVEGVNRGYTLVGQYNFGNGKVRNPGRVYELDKNGKEKWSIDELSYPTYACKTARDRVLICEQNGYKVTERDVKANKVLWTKQMANNMSPVACERLPNGNTMIATRNALIEVNKAGEDVRTYSRNNYDVITAGRHKDGTYSVVTQNGTIIRLDSSFKQTSTHSLGRAPGFIQGFKCSYLPKGGLVVPEYSYAKIREYDSTGKMLHEFDAAQPMCVSKLTNGHYVYLSRNNNNRGGAIVELDKSGKQVSSRTLPGNNNLRSQPLFMERK